nr:DMT family transporter [uncultured Lichenicoccus sp.]
MDPAIEFGLLTALLYGVSDFVAKFSSRAVGVWRTLFWGELCSALLLSLWIAFDASGNGAARAAFAQPWPVWAVAIASNMTILAATAIFYRALTVGRFSVVMPIVATYGAITALLSMLLGEPLGLVAVGGIAMAVLGAALASVPPRSAPDTGRMEAGPVVRTHGIGLASLAALLYGIGFCVQARYAVPRLGHLIPVWLYYVLGCALLGSVGRIMRRDLSPPSVAQLPVVLGTGLAASGAFVALTLAVTGGDVAVPTVLASLASVVTVLLARLLIKEQVALHQWAGIAAVVSGLLMLHASPLHPVPGSIAAAGGSHSTG